jgi:hypothetical protein
MTRLEALKLERKESLIVVCTLGLAAVKWKVVYNSARDSNRGMSWEKNEGISFVFKCFFFLMIAIPWAIIAFVVHLFRLIYFSIRIGNLTNSGNNGRHTNRNTNSPVLDIFTATYYYQDGNQLYGPISIEELTRLDIRANTPLAVNNSNNWKYAGDIPDLLETLRYVRN